ncbi:MAG: hypothetical protein LAT58_01435, partial [Opitutales bacterium]|nr:hypothetical protein [Opitutales bacterium]
PTAKPSLDCANLLALSVKPALLANLSGSVTPQQAAAGKSGKSLPQSKVPAARDSKNNKPFLGVSVGDHKTLAF